MLPETTQVIIVGAGPAGLALGATLAAKQIDVVLIDQLAHGQATSRAAAVHARTLEVLEEIGISNRLVTAGLQVPGFVARDRDEELLTVSFADLPTRYPYVLMLPQNETETVLARRLEELGGAIHRSCEAIGMHQDEDGVAVTIRAAGAPERTVRARYAVGADGYHSLVRERAGIGMQAATYAQSFVLGDVRMEWPYGADAAQMFLAQEGLLLVAPFPHGRHRIIATLDAAPEHPTREDLQAIINERGPRRSAAKVHEVHWASRFRIHHGVASAFRSGRVFLVGDAAHVHSPAGGQGMNIGIQDACHLGDLLAAVLTGRADASALDEYETERRPVAERVVSQTDRLTRVVTLKGSLRRELRNWAIEIVGHLPGVRQSLARQFAELDD